MDALHKLQVIITGDSKNLTKSAKEAVKSISDIQRKMQDYVKAARLSGTPTVKLVLKHILPNAIDPIIVDATMSISSMLLSAAGLSFIGLGIEAPMPEWGAMISDARSFLRGVFYFVSHLLFLH